MATNGAGAGTTTASNDLTAAATDLYVNSFQDVEPRRVHALLTSRLRQAEQFNQDLAEYFKQRSLIEDTYVKSILRLARHPITSVGSGPTIGPGEELGDGLGKLRDVLEKELTEIATTHTVFQRRMLQEVEVPLREKSSKFEWGRTRTYDTNLLSTIKELEEAEAKASKSSAKLAASPGGKKHDALQQKADEDRRHLSRVRDQYLTESPFTLQHYQTVDSDRLTFLAETMARFETIQNDHARERMELAEKGMVQILAFDPREETQAFAVRYGTVSGASGARSSSRLQTNGRLTAEQRDRDAMPPPSAPASAAPGIARHASVRSSSRQSASDAPSIRSSNAPTSHGTSSGGGLKSRFTGILNRSHRNSHMPSFHSTPTPESPAPTPSITTTHADDPATPTRGSSRLGGDLTPRQSRLGDDESNAGDLLGPSLTPERATTPTDSGAKVNRRSSFLPGMMQRRKTSKSAPSRPPNDIRRGSSTTAAAANKAEPLPSPPMSGGTTGSGYEMAQQDALAAISEDRARDRPLPQMRDMQGAGIGAGVGLAAGAGLAAAGAHANKVDDEGFSLPPPDHDRKPWEGAGAGPQDASLLDDDDQPNSAGPSSSGVAQFAIAPAPAPSSQQSPAEQDAALQRMKSTLLSSASGPQRRATGGPRGRRDVRNSAFIGTSPIPDDMPLAEAQRLRDVPQGTGSPGFGGGAFSASPPGSAMGLPSASSPTAIGAGVGSPFDVSRSGSLSSDTSNLARQAANPFGSPSMVGSAAAAAGSTSTTGLRASITETVNVLIKGGVVQRAMVTGEVGLLLKDLPPGPVRFRVTNFGRFEKAAPNPSLLQAIPDSPGEYQLDRSLFDRQGERQVVLKYQVKLGGAEDSKPFVPIEVTPQWRCEPTQTSFLLNYNLNPACNLLTSSAAEESPFGESSTAAIEQVSFVGQLSASVASVQSRPEGEWNPAEGKMTWKVDDFPLSSSAGAPRKILTRFVHDKEGLNTVSPLAVRWIVKGRNVSGVGLEIVSSGVGGEGAVMKFEEVAMTTVSGKFLAA